MRRVRTGEEHHRLGKERPWGKSIDGAQCAAVVELLLYSDWYYRVQLPSASAAVELGRERNTTDWGRKVHGPSIDSACTAVVELLLYSDRHH
jgi:hypothetical protein